MWPLFVPVITGHEAGGNQAMGCRRAAAPPKIRNFETHTLCVRDDMKRVNVISPFGINQPLKSTED
jgi:hypothetical protein